MLYGTGILHVIGYRYLLCADQKIADAQFLISNLK